MKTTEEIAELLRLAAGQAGRAVRIERELGNDPAGALRSAKTTALGAVRAINELLEDDTPAPESAPERVLVRV